MMLSDYLRLMQHPDPALHRWLRPKFEQAVGKQSVIDNVHYHAKERKVFNPEKHPIQYSLCTDSRPRRSYDELLSRFEE